MGIIIGPGEVLRGYCNGYFGRDSYEDKQVEAVGYDWVVARGVDSRIPLLATFSSDDEMQALLNQWRYKTTLKFQEGA